MKIALVAPLMESVPPKLYGGTERVVSVLAEGLVARGHKVTLFASGDSRTAAELVPCCPHGLRLNSGAADYTAYALTQLGDVYRRAAEFDVIHNHVDYFAFPFARLTTTATLTTTHGRLDLPEVLRVYELFPEQALVSISRSQRAPLSNAKWITTVYNGLNLTAFTFRSEPGTYMAFVGRISPEKRVDRAIEIARDVGMPLVIAAKVDPTDRGYYEAAIEPMIRSSPNVEYVGEIDDAQKNALLGSAYASLFPVDWPEPFGLVMIESMACGTPVIALPRGSTREVIASGKTGFICDSYEEMVRAVRRLDEIDRQTCRRYVETKFSAHAMAVGYEQIYRRLVSGAAGGTRKSYGKAA